jgi:hypothetical protein
MNMTDTIDRTESNVRTPLWVWVVIALIACIEPMLHLWIEQFPPEGAAPTGLHVPDSAFFIHSMAMFDTGFYLPYATCLSEWGDRHIGFFSSTGYWLYGAVGQLGTLLGAGHFLWLGIANGIFGFVYLYVAWRFFLVAAPQVSRLAFLLFAIGGGPGGLLYLATGVFGLHNHEDFDRLFYPFAMYELFEGPNLSPALHMTRLYYTVPLALGIGGLTALIKGAQIGCSRHIGFSAFLIFVCTVLHIRNGAFITVAGLLFLWQQAEAPASFRIRSAISWILAVTAGGALYMAVILQHPTVTQNTFDTVRQSAWFVPLLLASMFFLIPVSIQLRNTTSRLSRLARCSAFAAMGYLIAFTLCFGVYQIVQGNLPVYGNAAAASVVSDIALIGAAVGFVIGWRQPLTDTRAPQGWMVLWLLLFTCGTISAFGQGWYLQFAPQRLMVVLGIPLCVVAALGLQSMFESRAVLARLHLLAIVVCGIFSITVGALFIQGPLGHEPGQGPYASFHAQWMTDEDEALIQFLGANSGNMLVQPPFGDIAAARGTAVIYGLPSIQADQLAVPLEADVRRFFALDAGADFRAAFLKKYCIPFVYCPDTFPADPALIDQFDAWDGLTPMASQGKGRVWLVTPGEVR